MSTMWGACTGASGAWMRDCTHRRCIHHKFTCECVQHCNKFVACLKLCARIEMSAVKNKTSAVMVASTRMSWQNCTYIIYCKSIYTYVHIYFICIYLCNGRYLCTYYYYVRIGRRHQHAHFNCESHVACCKVPLAWLVGMKFHYVKS